MHPKERLQEDLKVAMKAGDVTRRDTIRLLQAAIRQLEVDSRTTLTEEQVYSLLMNEAKKRRDTITEAQNAGRDQLANNEALELALIEHYLPTQLTKEEIEAEVRAAMEESGAKTAKDMGKLMRVLMPRVKNRADGKLVNDIVKTLLTEA